MFTINLQLKMQFPIDFYSFICYTISTIKLRKEVIKMKITADFNQWARREYRECLKVTDSSDKFQFLHYKNKDYIINLDNGRMGVAQCHKDDKYDAVIAIAVAWAHYKGEEVPVSYKPVALKNLKPQDVYYSINSSNETKEYRLIGHLTENVIVVYDIEANSLKRVSKDTTVYTKK